MNTVPTITDARYEPWRIAVRKHIEQTTASEQERAAIIAAGVDFDAASPFDRFTYVELHRNRIGAPVTEMPPHPAPAWARTTDLVIGNCGEIQLWHRGEVYGLGDISVYVEQLVTVVVFPEQADIEDLSAPLHLVDSGAPLVTWDDSITSDGELPAAKALRFALALAAAANELDTVQSSTADAPQS